VYRIKELKKRQGAKGCRPVLHYIPTLAYSPETSVLVRLTLGTEVVMIFAIP
jgi:hypothetical protein